MTKPPAGPDHRNAPNSPKSNPENSPKKSPKKHFEEKSALELSTPPRRTSKFADSLANKLSKKPKKPETLKFPNGLKLEIAKGKEFIPPKKHPEQWEYYDPHNSGNRILKINESDLDKQISEHFKVRDFVRIDTKDLKYVKAGTYLTIKRGNSVECYRKFARIDKKLILLVESIRKDSGVPMLVNEGFRPYGENKRMYEDRPGKDALRSRHISGQALDFENNDKRILMSALFLMRNNGGIGLYSGKNALHFDCRASKRRWDKDQWTEDKEWPTSRWLSEKDIQEVKNRIAKSRKRKKRPQ